MRKTEPKRYLSAISTGTTGCAYGDHAERTLTALFRAYIEEPQQLPPDTLRSADQHPEGLHRVV